MKASQVKHFKICLPICYLQECMLVYALLTLSWQKAGKAFYWTTLKRSSLGILLCDILLVSLAKPSLSPVSSDDRDDRIRKYLM